MMGTAKKIIVGGVSVMLVVAVAIAVAVSVGHKHNSGDKNNYSAEGDDTSTTVKAISTICAPTDYKEACEKSLSEAVKQNSTGVDPQALIKAAFLATIEEIKKALNHSSSLGNTTNDPMTKMALSDCQDLLQDAIQELQASFSAVGDNDMHTMADRVDEINNWLSAVISYQETCKDGIPNPEIKSAVSNGMVNASQLTSNALAIITEISSIFSTFKIPLDFNANSRRRLLEEEDGAELPDLDGEGLPSWLSATDRKLLVYHDTQKLKPNVVVAQDESGNFKTITDALKAMPEKRTGRYIIYVKAGMYKESVSVEENMINVFMFGDGPRKTVVTGSKNFVDGTPTFQTASFAVVGTGFICKSMGFRNTAGPEKHQAVALRVKSDMSAFYNCRMDAYQDTLYVQTHRQFYRNCIISGTVDFIFGDASVVLQNCLLVVRKPMDGQQNIVTAQGRKDKRERTGIVIHNSRIVPEKKLGPTRFQTKSYLGRPWKEYARAVFMESTIADFIQPAGYMPWMDGEKEVYTKTSFYGEYGNRGPGARTSGRVKWPGVKVISRNEALQFTTGMFLEKENPWLRYTGARYIHGLKR